jgi:glycosyltransferase involved in cell wall biosynthesis
MSIKPRVSVIIPTYNDSKNLIIAIESVLSQSFKEFEIIVVDDGSTDETKSILKPYIESNKIIYLYQENSGVGQARFKGITISQGEYISFLDSDDEWVDKDKIENQVEFLINNLDYVLVGTGVINVDSNNKEINRYLMPENDEKIRQKILRINTFINSSVLLRKSSFEKVGSSLSILEDYDLWLKLGTIGKLKNLPIYAVKFRLNFQGHGARNKNERLKENLVLSKKYRDIYPNYIQAFLLGYIKIYFYPIFEILPLKIKCILLKLHKKL